MAAQKFLENARRILRIARRPGRREFWLAVRVSIFGFLLIGSIGFVIQLIASVLIGT